LRAPTLIALAAGLLTGVFVTRLGWVVLAVTLGTFVASAIVGLLVELTLNRTRKSEAAFVTEVRTVVGGDQPFWAGQLSHLGVVLVAIGIAFAANLGTHAVVDLEPGESVDFAGYQLVYESPFRRVEPNRVVEGARITVLRGTEAVALLEPRANFYGADAAGVVTPAVLTTPAGDLYLTLKALDSETLTLGLDTSPMVWLLWLGGLTTAAGGVWSLLARRSVRRGAVERQSADA
jgi:cytochrome c-type biogenesis protein CcmF